MKFLSPLSFDKNHRFKIVQFTDIHWKDQSPHEARLLGMLESIVEWEKPDFVVLTGDSVHSPTNTLAGCAKVTLPMVKREIPWAVVLGNHDHEGNATRAEIADCFENLPFSLMQRGPKELGGEGNYSLDIYQNGSQEVAARLYFLDTHTYSPLKAQGVGGYAWITREQIRWFESVSKGKNMPSLAFFHIPLPEYLTAWEKGITVGQKKEVVCAPELNSGFFATLVEAGSILGTFVGHDHVNDFAAMLHGVCLTYGRSLGLDNYGDAIRGARVIEMIEGEKDFKSWIREENGAVVDAFSYADLRNRAVSTQK